jgi:hypothetical protein
MISDSLAFIPGNILEAPFPLARFLPPIPQGVASTWLTEQGIPAGSWVLDPFGANPRQAVEVARAGYRVLVAANNPVARFLLEMNANPPAESALRAALANVAASYKGDERIEPHLRSLYLTDCVQCGREIMADAFLWERGARTPFGRIYHCPYCGDSGEHPASEKDAEKALSFGNIGLHRARALERVAGPQDPDRPHVKEALDVYLPRALYAIFTLVNKLDRMPVLGNEHTSEGSFLTALLLTTADQANSLWAYPSGRARPRQLTVPPRFRENNVWLALENSISLWAHKETAGETAVSLTTWPDLAPESGGITVFEGRLKSLGPDLERIHIAAVLASLPRPNQAFWTLSALWAGWLWGKEAAAPFKSVLRRRRYDWSWHCSALATTYESLLPHLAAATPFYSLIGEAEAGFLTAAMVAAYLNGFNLSGLALRAKNGQAQMLWQSGRKRPGAEGNSTASPSTETSREKHELAVEIQELCINAAQDYLRKRGEPSGYLNLHTAALSDLVQTGFWPELETLSPGEVAAQVQTTFQQIFTFRKGFLRFGGSQHSLDIGQWWLQNEGINMQAPLSDRVEMAIVPILQNHPGKTLPEIDQVICADFSGLLTPEIELVLASVDSYGEQDPPDSGGWTLREQDQPRSRHKDLQEIKGLLTQIGKRLGYKIFDPSTSEEVKGQLSLQLDQEMRTHQPVAWASENEEIIYVFHLRASAVIGELILQGANLPYKSLLVIPGGRAGLIAYKLAENPLLRRVADEKWQFIKFRHVRRLAKNTSLTRENLEEMLILDPLSSSDPQIPLF